MPAQPLPPAWLAAGFTDKVQRVDESVHRRGTGRRSQTPVNASCAPWLLEYAAFHAEHRHRPDSSYLVYTCRPVMPQTNSHCLGFGALEGGREGGRGRERERERRERERERERERASERERDARSLSDSTRDCGVSRGSQAFARTIRQRCACGRSDHEKEHTRERQPSSGERWRWVGLGLATPTSTRLEIQC